MDSGGRRDVTRNRPMAHESDVAAVVGGRKQPGSGSQEHSKGDVRRDHDGFPLLVECKLTTKQSLRVEGGWLNKISAEAGRGGDKPALAMRWDPAVLRRMAAVQGVPAAEADWVAVPASVFRRMLEALGEEGLYLE